ncbi:MAG: hypothetical protein PVG39_22610, partial [Desulfobacteraceae bacterium]
FGILRLYHWFYWLLPFTGELITGIISVYLTGKVCAIIPSMKKAGNHLLLLINSAITFSIEMEYNPLDVILFSSL